MQAKTLRLRMRDVGLAQNAVPSTAELQLELSTNTRVGFPGWEHKLRRMHRVLHTYSMHGRVFAFVRVCVCVYECEASKRTSQDVLHKTRQHMGTHDMCVHIHMHARPFFLGEYQLRGIGEQTYCKQE